MYDPWADNHDTRIRFAEDRMISYDKGRKIVFKRQGDTLLLSRSKAHDHAGESFINVKMAETLGSSENLTVGKGVDHHRTDAEVAEVFSRYQIGGEGQLFQNSDLIFDGDLGPIGHSYEVEFNGESENNRTRLGVMVNDDPYLSFLCQTNYSLSGGCRNAIASGPQGIVSMMTPSSEQYPDSLYGENGPSTSVTFFRKNGVSEALAAINIRKRDSEWETHKIAATFDISTREVVDLYSYDVNHHGLISDSKCLRSGGKFGDHALLLHTVFPGGQNVDSIDGLVSKAVGPCVGFFERFLGRSEDELSELSNAKRSTVLSSFRSGHLPF